MQRICVLILVRNCLHALSVLIGVSGVVTFPDTCIGTLVRLLLFKMSDKMSKMSKIYLLQLHQYNIALYADVYIYVCIYVYIT